MTRTRPAVILILVLAVLGASATAAQACDKTWVGGSNHNGNWGEPGAWSPSGVPGSEQSVCITVSGTYTVVLPANGGVAKTLVVGGSSGVQTIDVAGESWNNAGNTSNETKLSAETMSFAANTKLVLDATANGSALPKGAGGVLAVGSIAELGQIETVSSDPTWANRVHANNMTLAPGASVLDASGSLLFLEEGEGAHPWAVDNEGTFTVNTAASLTMQPSFAGLAKFTNVGAVVNNGTLVGSGIVWLQQGGSESGNPVELQSPPQTSASLVDSSGVGGFLFNYGTVTLAGTIPAGQTVKVLGVPYNYGGENYYETSVSLGGKELVNDGSLIFEAPGSGETSGGNVNVEAGSIDNNGTITAEGETTRRIQLLGGITNGPSGHLEIDSGVFQDNNGATLTNEGLVTLAAGAVLQLQEAGAFINKGTFSPDIASASSYGMVKLNSPCCNGPGVFTAGGSLSPVTVGGFTPTTGQEFDIFALEGGKFEGTFGSVANGFSADYTHETSEHAFVGVTYGTGGAGVVGKQLPPLPPFAQVLGASTTTAGKLVVKLSCPAGALACQAVSVQATVTERLKGKKITALLARKGKKKTAVSTKRVVIASGTVTLAAGTAKTLTLSLNSAGKALLARYGKLASVVRVSSAGKTLETFTLHLKKATKTKKK